MCLYLSAKKSNIFWTALPVFICFWKKTTTKNNNNETQYLLSNGKPCFKIFKLAESVEGIAFASVYIMSNWDCFYYITIWDLILTIVD